MKVEVKVPSVGESIVSGILSKWLKKNNDIVIEGEPVFEIETDKVNVEVPSPAAGKIEILVAEGEDVQIGQLAAYIDTDFNQSGIAKKEFGKADQEKIKEKFSVTPSEAGENKNGASQKTSPSVRKISGENNVDLSLIKGTGKEGRITKEDVIKNIKEPEFDKRQTVVKMSPIRSTIAKRLLQARHEAAHVTTFNEINMEKIKSIRTKYKDEFFKKYGIKLGLMSFFVKASCRALKDFPDINTEIRNDEIIYNHFYNIGVAVSVDEGLIVPVIKDADKMSFAQIELKINELSEKARMRKITLDELENGTFSITNGGIFGSMLSTPIPNYPQTAILGMHSIKDRPYVINGNIEIKPIMYVALTYDHRVIDGKDAVEFLVSIKKYAEAPESLLIEL